MNLENILGCIANVATITGFIFANYQFLQWRKQQRYSIEFSTLLDIEDQFELLIYYHMSINAITLKMKKAAKNAKSPQERADFDKNSNSQHLMPLQKALEKYTEIEKSYSLLIFRGKRIRLWQQTPQELDAAYINTKFNTLIENDNSLEETATAVSKIKEAAYHELEKIRKKYV